MGYVVFSAFDGMSCGQIAFKELGIKVDKYYASEVDKYAIMQTQHNFPNTIQLGSIVDVDVSKLDPIDILIGGSPCQSFSFAGKRNGMTTVESEEIYTLDRYLELKSEGFQFEGQSYLFWEYMRILTDIRKYNPDVKFLLENVEMGDKWERVLSEAIGVFGVHINSALVSAQNRKRIYWTNIRVKEVGLFGELHSDIPQPKDERILLKDILEKEVDEKYYLSEKGIAGMLKHKENNTNNGNGFGVQFITRETDKSNSILQRGYKDCKDNALCVAQRVRESSCLSPKRTEYGKQIRKDYEAGLITEQRKNIQQLEPRQDGKTNTITTVQKDNLVLQIKEATSKGYTEINPGECFDMEQPNSNTRRGRKMDTKSNSLMAQNMSFMNYTENYRIRRLTPTECARLQTIPEWYEWKFVESNYFGYICSVTKKTIICKANVTPMAVSDRFQINQQDYATCTTLDLLELEKQRVEKLTKQKSVKLTAAIDMLKQNNTETYVSCITKDFIGMERGNFQSNNIKKNVSFVIKKLVAEELTECAPVIIEVSNYMEIHLLLKKGKTNLKYQLNQQDIMGVKIKNRDTKQLWSIKLGDLLKTEKLSTILTLVNWIIDRKIYIYAKDVLNIRLSIGNLNVSEQNYIGVELSDLRMESIISCSDTQQYKLLGNGWTVKVIMHILKYLNSNEKS